MSHLIVRIFFVYKLLQLTIQIAQLHVSELYVKHTIVYNSAFRHATLYMRQIKCYDIPPPSREKLPAHSTQWFATLTVQRTLAGTFGRASRPIPNPPHQCQLCYSLSIEYMLQGSTETKTLQCSQREESSSIVHIKTRIHLIALAQRHIVVYENRVERQRAQPRLKLRICVTKTQ